MGISLKTKGIIDLHTHGLGGFGTRGGTPEDVVAFARIHKKKGTALILPTIYAGPIERMRLDMEAVRKAMEKEPSIAGVNLEGPFLNPLRAGALEGKSFIEPSLGALGRLIRGYEEIIKVITVAPELKGALKVIEKCAGSGIRVNMGHSDATYKEALSGKRAGATGVTHLFNAMRPFHHREPGLAGLALLDDDLYVEVIPDGVHLSSETLRLIFGVKKKERIILVSDTIKGPSGRAVMKKGILQGGGMCLSEGTKYLRGMGISDLSIRLASTENPLRYLKGR